MKRCSTAQLREKEIINLCDGMRLGYADDFEFDLNDAPYCDFFKKSGKKPQIL